MPQSAPTDYSECTNKKGLARIVCLLVSDKKQLFFNDNKKPIPTLPQIHNLI